MHLSRAVNTADQYLFNIRRATGPGNEDDSATRRGDIRVARNGELFEDFFQAADYLISPVEHHVDGRSKRRELRAFGDTREDKGARFRENEVDSGDPNLGGKSSLAIGLVFHRGLAVLGPDGEANSPRRQFLAQTQPDEEGVSRKDHSNCPRRLENRLEVGFQFLHILGPVGTSGSLDQLRFELGDKLLRWDEGHDGSKLR